MYQIWKEAIMKIGVSLFPGRYPIDAAVMAQKAEALGFDSLWVGERPDHARAEHLARSWLLW